MALTGAQRAARYRARLRGENVSDVSKDANARRSRTLLTRFRRARRCDSCEAVSATVRRFTLSRHAPAGGRVRGANLGAGGLDLCLDCWETLAPTCFICGAPDALQRYTTRARVYRGQGLRQSTMAGGSVVLCARCHRNVAEPRMGMVGPWYDRKSA